MPQCGALHRMERGHVDLSEASTCRRNCTRESAAAAHRKRLNEIQQEQAPRGRPTSGDTKRGGRPPLNGRQEPARQDTELLVISRRRQKPAGESPEGRGTSESYGDKLQGKEHPQWQAHQWSLHLMCSPRAGAAMSSEVQARRATDRGAWDRTWATVHVLDKGAGLQQTGQSYPGQSCTTPAWSEAFRVHTMHRVAGVA